jgi:hypothetical protein
VTKKTQRAAEKIAMRVWRTENLRKAKHIRGEDQQLYSFWRGHALLVNT